MSDTMEITREKWQHWIDTLAGGDDSTLSDLKRPHGISTTLSTCRRPPSGGPLSRV